MPSDWWDSPAVAACPLGTGAQSGRTARRFTRNTLKEWGLAALADDAEAIVGEFVANAVAHATRCVTSGQPIGVRLLRRTGEVMCAVLDPSDSAPVLRVPDRTAEAGRGLQMVDALSDVWGWSPVTGRGKAVWAILFCALPARGLPAAHNAHLPCDPQIVHRSQKSRQAKNPLPLLPLLPAPIARAGPEGRHSRAGLHDAPWSAIAINSPSPPM